MLRTWNVSLVLATGFLAILGTFLVRSGVLESIHAFGASTLGIPFLVFVSFLAVGSAWLVLSRRDGLRSEHRIDSLLSREAIFLFNNLVLVALCFVIFRGTFFPLISEAVTGTRQSVGPPWFDRYTVPLAIVLLLLSGAGPLLAWRRVTASGLRRSFGVPVAVAVVVAAALAVVPGVTARPSSLLLFAIAAFVVAGTGQEFVRGVRARRAATHEAAPVALAALVRRNRTRYGGYLVHVGMAVLFVGFDGESTSEVGLRAGAHRDVWTAVQPDIGPLRRLIDDANTRFASASANVQALAVAGLVAHYEGKPPPATFRFIVSPLVEWIWVGGLVVLFGGLIAIWPAAALAEARARVARVVRRRGVDGAPAASSVGP